MTKCSSACVWRSKQTMIFWSEAKKKLYIYTYQNDAKTYENIFC